jgi:cytochrome c2
MKKLAVCEGFFVLTAAMIAADVKAQDLPVGDASRGRAYFQISCAVCHSSELGTNNTVISKQGPSLVGVVGRKAASSPHFNYTQALTDFGLNWDATTLNKFLVNPLTAVPGTHVTLRAQARQVNANSKLCAETKRRRDSIQGEEV